MRKIFVILFAVIVVGSYASTQDYHTGIGFRGGLSQGLTIKHFINSDTAIEGLLSARWGGFHVTGLYELHAPAFSVSGLNWYYGLGGHLGSWSNGKKTGWWDDDGNHTVLGVDGIVGIEYTIRSIPFSISLDYKPAINLINHFGFWFDEFALSIRYVW